MVLATKAFNKLVETYPETIKCEAQNKPITKAFHPSSDSWDSPREILAEEQVITLASGYKSKEVVFLCDSFIKNVLSVYELILQFASGVVVVTELNLDLSVLYCNLKQNYLLFIYKWIDI